MKYWVFDLDGTLVNSFDPYFEFLERVVLERKISSEEKKHFSGMHITQICAQKFAPEKVKEIIQQLMAESVRHTESIFPFPGLQKTVESLKQKNRRIAVWTARDKVTAEHVLQKTGLDTYVEHLVSRDCVANPKPNPEGLLRIQQFFGCKLDEMIMVGDHEHDMSGGRTAGVFSVRASWHKQWKDPACSLAHKQFFDDHEFHMWVKRQIE